MATRNPDLPDRPTGLFRRALHRLSADPRQLDAEDLHKEATAAGATPVARCPDKEQVCVAGTLNSVKLRPRGGAPTLEAELYDGTGTVTLVWLGRRRIAGIEPGRSMVARGRLMNDDGRWLIHNPRYELRPTRAARG